VTRFPRIRDSGFHEDDGTMTALHDESEMGTVVPEYQKLLAAFSFKNDESYAAFQKGDKIAEYGLTGLIVVGGLLAAAKTGLLAKLWKPIVAGVVVVGAFLKRIFTGRTRESI
jgi:uncharacterized membrane-anchored protein